MKKQNVVVVARGAFLGLIAGLAGIAVGQDVKEPPGRYHTSWVGNSFGGNGGPNGFGYWVQNGRGLLQPFALRPHPA